MAFSQTLGTPLDDRAAFILTRPPGATIDDFLDKPINQCGLNLGRDPATAVSIAAIRLALIAIPGRGTNRALSLSAQTQPAQPVVM